MSNKKTKTVDVPIYTESDYNNDQNKFEESIETGKLDLSAFHRLMTHDLCMRTSVIETGCIGDISVKDIELALKHPKQGWKILLLIHPLTA